MSHDDLVPPFSLSLHPDAWKEVAKLSSDAFRVLKGLLDGLAQEAARHEASVEGDLRFDLEVRLTARSILVRSIRRAATGDLDRAVGRVQQDDAAGTPTLG